MRRFLIIFALLLLTGLGLFYFYYQQAAEQQLTQALTARGIKVQSLTLDELTTTSATLSNITFGDSEPLTLARLNVDYRLQEVVKGTFRAIDAHQLKITAYQQEGAWKIGGLEPLMQARNTAPSSPFLPERVTLTDSTLMVRQGDENWQFSVTGEAHLANNVLQGTLHAEEHTRKLQTDIAFTLPAATPAQGMITLKNLRFPWGGGIISVANVRIPLALNTPITLRVQLKNVELASLLSEVSEQITASGRVSGTLPITYYPDGRLTLQKGAAQALESGMLHVPPSLLPGENEQLAVARTALENFHYTHLNIQLSSGKDSKSIIRLELEGNNPEAFGGRPIKLTVNLAGDIIPLIQQSILPLNNVSKLLHLKDAP